MSFGTVPEMKIVVEGHVSNCKCFTSIMLQVTDSIKQTYLKYIHYEAVVTFHVAI